MSIVEPKITLRPSDEHGPQHGRGLSHAFSDVLNQRHVWRRIRALVLSWYFHRCAICNSSAVSCHEVWEHNRRREAKILADLWAICPLCHSAVHGEALGEIGWIAGNGHEKEVTAEFERLFVRVDQKYVCNESCWRLGEDWLLLRSQVISHIINTLHLTPSEYVMHCKKLWAEANSRNPVVWKADLSRLPKILRHYEIDERTIARVSSELGALRGACDGNEADWLHPHSPRTPLGDP